MISNLKVISGNISHLACDKNGCRIYVWIKTSKQPCEVSIIFIIVPILEIRKG